MRLRSAALGRQPSFTHVRTRFHSQIQFCVSLQPTPSLRLAAMTQVSGLQIGMFMMS